MQQLLDLWGPAPPVPASIDLQLRDQDRQANCTNQLHALDLATRAMLQSVRRDENAERQCNRCPCGVCVLTQAGYLDAGNDKAEAQWPCGQGKGSEVECQEARGRTGRAGIVSAPGAERSMPRGKGHIRRLLRRCHPVCHQVMDSRVFCTCAFNLTCRPCGHYTDACGQNQLKTNSSLETTISVLLDMRRGLCELVSRACLHGSVFTAQAHFSRTLSQSLSMVEPKAEPAAIKLEQTAALGQAVRLQPEPRRGSRVQQAGSRAVASHPFFGRGDAAMRSPDTKQPLLAGCCCCSVCGARMSSKARPRAQCHCQWNAVAQGLAPGSLS